MMKDLEIEYYLGLLAILGIEIYSSGNNSKIKNNILKGGFIGTRSAAKLAGKGAVGAAKLAGKGAVGTAKLAGKGAVGTAKYVGSKMGVHSSSNLSKEGQTALKKMKDKDAAKKAFDSRNWKSDAAKGAAKSIGKGIGKGAAAGASAGLKGIDNAGEFIKNLVNPSTFVIIGLIVGCIMFTLFLGGPSILIISLLVASWYFLRNQINRYFPTVDSNPVMKSNNNQNNQNNNNF